MCSNYLAQRRSKKGAMLSKASYGGIVSAYMYLINKAGYKISPEFQKDLNTFQRGMKRKVTSKKVKSGRSLEEGKKPMNFDVYKLMCKKLLQMEKDEGAFAHLFLILEWNLMARASNCLLLHLGHIEWRNNCLVFFFGKSKRDQTGENSNNPWHVYSNPYEPCICPVLAMAQYVCSYPDIATGKARLFPGNNQYNRFLKIFHRVVEANIEGFQALGVTKQSLGAHSPRKGAITMVSTGCTVSPPMASICLRAAWSMGSVKDRYIHYEKAGDQFTGRCCTGISSLTKEFAASPVYFDYTTSGNTGKKAVTKAIQKNFMNSRLVEPHVFELLRYFYAAMCYHFDFLDKNLSSKHPLRASTLFTSCKRFKYRRLATITFPWNSTDYSPGISGIPPHTMLLVQVERLKKDLNEQADKIVSGLKQELDNRSVGGMAFEAKELLGEIKDLLQQQRTSTQSSYPSDDENSNSVFAEIQTETTKTTTTVTKKKLSLYTHSGRLVLLPEHYTFAKLTLATLITAWHCGNDDAGIPPYKHLTANAVKHIKFGKNKISMMQLLMSSVKRATVIKNQPNLLKKEMTIQDCAHLYSCVKHMFEIPGKNEKSRRHETLSWKTVYNRLAAKNWQLYGEQSGSCSEAPHQRKKPPPKQKEAPSKQKNSSAQPAQQSSAKKKSTRKRKASPKSTSSNSQPKRRSKRTKQNMIEDAFARQFDLPNAEEQKRLKERTEVRKHECSLGDDCICPLVPRKFNCCRSGCVGRIHHLCADQKKLWVGDEMNVFCSSICMP